MQTLLVTGGAGFIGANFVLQAVADGLTVVNLDKLTYAGNLDTLATLDGNRRHIFVQGDIGDRAPGEPGRFRGFRRGCRHREARPARRDP